MEVSFPAFPAGDLHRLALSPFAMGDCLRRTRIILALEIDAEKLIEVLHVCLSQATK